MFVLKSTSNPRGAMGRPVILLLVWTFICGIAIAQIGPISPGAIPHWDGSNLVDSPIDFSFPGQLSVLPGAGDSILWLESTTSSQYDQHIRFQDPTSTWFIGNTWTADSVDGFGIGRTSEKRDLVLIPPYGNLGVGFSAPATAVHVRRSSADAILTLESGTSSQFDQGVKFVDPTSTWHIGNTWTADNIDGFGIGRTSEKRDLVLTPPYGNLGVGFSTPSTAVHVRRDAADAILTLESGTSSQFDQGVKFVDPTSTWYVGNSWVAENVNGFGIGRSSHKRDFMISADGNVGVGMKPTAARMSVDGVVAVSGGLMFRDGSLQTTATLSGPKGDAGAKGDKGDVGPAGPKGDPGVPGPAVPTFATVSVPNGPNPVANGNDTLVLVEGDNIAINGLTGDRVEISVTGTVPKTDSVAALTGSGPPSSSPSEIGQFYIDTSTPPQSRHVYMSTGTSNSVDWRRIDFNPVTTLTGFGPPSFTPSAIGQFYINMATSVVTRHVYFSTGTTGSSNWRRIDRN